MSYYYQDFKCPGCGKVSNLQVDIWSNRGLVYEEINSDICYYCGSKISFKNEVIESEENHE